VKKPLKEKGVKSRGFHGISFRESVEALFKGGGNIGSKITCG